MNKVFRVALGLAMYSVLPCTMFSTQNPEDLQNFDFASLSSKAWGCVCQTATTVSNFLTQNHYATSILGKIRNPNESLKDMSTRLFLSGLAGSVSYEVSQSVLYNGSGIVSPAAGILSPALGTVVNCCSLAAQIFQKPISAWICSVVVQKTSNHFSEKKNLETVYTLGFNKFNQVKDWMMGYFNDQEENQ